MRSWCLARYGSVLVGGLIATACGRLGFDHAAADAGPADVAVDGCGPACAPFSPQAGTCTDADRGPFVEVDTFPTQGGGYGVWAAPPFVLAADTTGGLRSLRFDGTSFSEVGQLPALGWVEAVWSDGDYFYVGAPGTGLAVVTVAADGQLVQRAQNTAVVAEARRGWAADGVLYVPSGPDGLFAFRFDGATLSQVGFPTPTLSWSSGVWAQGSRVLFADGDRFRVLDFDGTTFTDAVAPDARHPGSSRVWSDGVTIFVASADGATAYRVQGTTLVELDTYPTAGTARDIWSDGEHVFVAAEAGGLSALTFENDQFALLETIDTGGTTLGVFGDGTFIYANDPSTGVHAYAGYACRTW